MGRTGARRGPTLAGQIEVQLFPKKYLRIQHPCSTCLARYLSCDRIKGMHQTVSSGLTRRYFLMSAATALAASAKPEPRRNVLFIASDDLNHCFSAYGHPVVRTPNLDSIARKGVRFD